MSNAAASGVVQLANVSISYGSNRALRDVTAVFQPGAVGLLSPNGAGRSTMLRALLGFLSSGTPPPVWTSLAWLAVIWVTSLALATRVVERREYVLEQ